MPPSCKFHTSSSPPVRRASQQAGAAPAAAATEWLSGLLDEDSGAPSDDAEDSGWDKDIRYVPQGQNERGKFGAHSGRPDLFREGTAYLEKQREKQELARDSESRKTLKEGAGRSVALAPTPPPIATDTAPKRPSHHAQAR
jgi:hypothetical protein